jgi:choice-of-anchor A domain-containing protein
MSYRRVPAARVAAFLAALVCGSTAFASAVLGAAAPYNVFVLNNFTSSYSDIQGGLAAGGNISITGYSVGAGLTSAQAATQFPLGDTLVSGGLLTAASGDLWEGNAYGATTNVTPNVFNLNGGSLTTGGSPVIDFSDVGVQLNSLSTSLAGMATTAGDTCTVAFGVTTTCTVVGNGLNVINVADPSVFAGKTINVNSTGSNVTLVINVAGATDSLGGAGFNVFDNGVTVLLNYYQANTVQLGSSAFTASVLAPLATVSASGGGNFNGNLIANNFSGQLEFHNTDLFSGDLPAAVPEPRSFLLGGAGFIAIGLLMRKHGTGRAANLRPALIDMPIQRRSQSSAS